MRTDFKFLNLCGGVYSQGNLVFTKSGKELLSPVGNRVATYDLQRSQNRASAFECLKDVVCMDMTEDEGLMVVVDEDGRGLFVNRTADVALEVMNFKPGTTKVKFSRNGRYLAVVTGRQVQIWSTPPNRVLQYRSIHMLRRITVTSGDVTSLQWSPCSKYLILGSEDCSVRIIPLSKGRAYQDGERLPIKPHVTLAAHRCPVMGVFFARKNKVTEIYSVASDRAVALWTMTDRDRLTPHGGAPKDDGLEVVEEGEEEEEEEAEEEEEEEEEEESVAVKQSALDVTTKNWQIKKKFFLQHDARLQVVEYATEKGLLFAGFKNGVFGIYTMEPEVRCIHTLSITEQKISSVAVSPNADWVAFGSSKLGQLLVWEWKSETYVLKQQSHYHDITTVAFSPDGSVIATSSDDGKVKVWNGATGFCFATFRDHQGPVSEVRFSNNTTLWSASADGTIRGYDLKRYRQFKILQPPGPAQLSCLTIDPAGELVAAGSITDSEVFLWSVQTGQLLEVFTQHEGPVSCIDFHNSGVVLASGSWDKTVRLSEVYSSQTQRETTAKTQANDTLRFYSEVLALKFSPNGKRLSTMTLNGDLGVWDCEDTTEVVPLRTVSVQRDVKGGWRSSEGTNPFRSANAARTFNHISWSPDSTHMLLGGNSKWIAVYSAERSFLVKKYPVTNNRSLEGMSDVYNYKAETEAGALHTMDLADSDSEDGARKVTKLPGAQRGDQGKRRKTRPVARASAIQWSPTGKEWAAATTDGLLLFSTEVDQQRFNPVQLSLGLTPQDTYAELDKGNHVLALLKALRLNDAVVLTRVLNGIPIQEIPFVADNLPTDSLAQFLDVLSKEIQEHRHLERYMRWAVAILSRHGAYLQKTSTAAHTGAPADGQLQASLKLLHQHVVKASLDLSKLAEQSKHALAFLSASAALEWQKKGSGTLGLEEAEAEEEVVPQLGHVKASKAENGDDEAADFPEDAEALEGQIATGEASATGGNDDDDDDASSSQEDEAAAAEKADPPSPVSQPKKVKKVVKRKAAAPAAEATPAKQAKKGSVKKGKKSAAKKQA